MLNECPEAVFLGGDFNASDSETDIMGPHIFGRGRDYLEGVAYSTKENRDLLVDFCRANALRILNTDFSKPRSKQATFRENTTSLEEPITAENHAQLDFWLTRSGQRNQCTDVQSRTDIYMQSDHYMVEVYLRIKLAAVGPHVNSCYAPKFNKPSERQWKLFNGFIRDQYCSVRGQLHWKGFTESLMQAAETCLSKASKPRKKNYLSTQTWSLIADRQRLFTCGLDTEVKALDRQIKKQARADRKKHIINQFHHAPGDPNRKNIWK